MLAAPSDPCGMDSYGAGDNIYGTLGACGQARGERCCQDQGRPAALPSLPPAVVPKSSALLLCRNPPFSERSANVAVAVAWHLGQGQLEPGGSVGSLEGQSRREL